jgi:hypothetical protein
VFIEEAFGTIDPQRDQQPVRAKVFFRRGTRQGAGWIARLDLGLDSVWTKGWKSGSPGLFGMICKFMWVENHQKTIFFLVLLPARAGCSRAG